MSLSMKKKQSLSDQYEREFPQCATFDHIWRSMFISKYIEGSATIYEQYVAYMY